MNKPATKSGTPAKNYPSAPLGSRVAERGRCQANKITAAQREEYLRQGMGYFRGPGSTVIKSDKCMGKVIIKIKLTNLFDLGAQHRKLSTAKPRSVEVEALVDTGATRLYLKPSVIRALGLEKVDEVISQTTNGPKKRSVYEPVRLEVQRRYGNFDVVDIGENVPNLLGQIPLEYLDFVVDPQGRKLIPNPEHGDKQMSEEY